MHFHRAHLCTLHFSQPFFNEKCTFAITSLFCQHCRALPKKTLENSTFFFRQFLTKKDAPLSCMLVHTCACRNFPNLFSMKNTLLLSSIYFTSVVVHCKKIIRKFCMFFHAVFNEKRCNVVVHTNACLKNW